MAGEDEKGKGKARGAAGGPPKLDRRDLLMGLSTVPALGLFGYAWNSRRKHRQGQGGGGRHDSDRCPRGLQESTSPCSAPALRGRC